MVISQIKDFFKRIWSSKTIINELELKLIESQQQLEKIIIDRDNLIKELVDAKKKILSLENEYLEPEQLPKPGIQNYISNYQLKKKLIEAFPETGENNIWLSDNSYGVLTKNQLINFLYDDKTNYKKWIFDYQDCDDFSLFLTANIKKWAGNVAIGILWIRKPFMHAVNVAYIDNRIVVIEPQTDAIFSKPEDYEGMLIVI